MEQLHRSRLWILALAIASVAGCRGSSGIPSGPQWPAAYETSGPARSPIKHVVLVIQENRTFNNFFATFPGADGTTTAAIAENRQCHIDKNETITLQEGSLIISTDLNHNYQSYETARDGGKMDGFDNVLDGTGLPECQLPYQYVNPSEIRPYWAMAEQYALLEHMFSTQGSSSFTAHQDLIRGGTIVAPGEAMINLPSCSGSTCRWGCDAPPGTRTALIGASGGLENNAGPFPCTNKFVSSYRTLRDLLDAKRVSWKYYVPLPCCNTNGRLFTAYDVVYAVRYGSEWHTNISAPQTNIFNDISSHKLPAVSWLIPVEPDSDHPGESIDDGPSWVASVVNAIGESGYWKSTAIVVVWDEWGGLYDNITPGVIGYGGLGPRVPALVISAYAKPGYISKTYYQFGSILKYIENNWGLGSLGTTDKTSESIVDCFNYSQAPLVFKPIASKYSESYFLHRKGAFPPPDTDM
jgi:phospholipase C